jgi:L-ascorbate metabolism protein UlaG (beta-lactamase superfamily)
MLEAIAERTKAVIVSNAEIASYYATKGFQAHPMNHGGSWNFDFGKVKYVNAIHSSSFPDGTNGGNPAVLLSRENTKHLHRGRYGPTMDMKLIPMRTKLIWLFCLLVTISLWISRMLS